jgi:aspartyl-tRNA(Asn)/glutamyl-tRNA(Gln) amidotransferase subunit A
VIDERLTRLTLADAAALVRARGVSPVDLADTVLERIATIDGALNCFTTLVPPERVRAEALVAERELAAGRHRGPLHGIPVGVKDLLDTAGLRTTYGSGIFREYVPVRDAAVATRLREAGAIVIGKTATHEFGMGITTNNYFFGPTLNPWHREHVPGGSSGGAAAATAAEICPLQIGTDGGGSVRIPAAFCGVVGHKPTLGLVSNRGQFGNGNVSFSVPGPLTRTVRDAAIATQALAGYDPEYAYSRPGPVPDLLVDLERGVTGLRIGTSPDLLRPEPDPPVAVAHRATLARLAALGAIIDTVDMPHHELLQFVTAVVFSVEGGQQTRGLIGDRPHLFSPAIAQLMTDAGTDAATWARAARDRAWLAHDYGVAFERVDVLVLPTTPGPAPRIGDDELPHVFRVVPYTAAVNLVGLAAASIPMGSSGGLPIGVQIIGPRGADALVLRVAHALEQSAADHRVQRPPL